VLSGIVEMQHHFSPLKFRCVCWSVLHDPIENFGAEAQHIEMISFGEDFDG
jgi:hypothetical protein